MPRPLDVQQRKADISRIAMDILAHSGPSGLTLRAVAEALGGSVTLVTHVYPTRAELMAGMVAYYTEEAIRESAERASHLAPDEWLWTLLQDMAPLDEETIRRERSRVALTSDRDQKTAHAFADSMEDLARARFADALRGRVPDDQLETAIAFCRALSNGVVLSAVEHPDYWTAERQRDVLALGMAAIRSIALPGFGSGADVPARA